MSTAIKIIGSSVCPACQMTGHDADFCRANLLSDDRILCYNCGSFIAPFEAAAMSVNRMPHSIKSFAATMLRERNVNTPALKLTMASFGPDGSSSQAAYACAQGNEAVILNQGYLIFSAGPYSFAKLEVKFMADELQDVPAEFSCPKTLEVDDESQQFLENLTLSSCPLSLKNAINKLIAIGFTVRRPLDFSGAHMRRVQLHCGGNIAGTSIPKGIMVEATYLV